MKLIVLAMCIALSLGATSFIFGKVADDDTKCYFYAKVADTDNSAAEGQSVFLVAGAGSTTIAANDVGLLAQSAGTTADSRTCTLGI